MSILRDFKFFDGLFIVLFVGIVLLLSACDGDDEQDLDRDRDRDINVKPDQALCAAVDGLTYVSDALGEGGLGVDGIVLSHWSVKFDAGNMSMRQSDFVMSGQYQCVDGEIELTSINVPSQTLQFSEDLSVLAFHPFAQEGQVIDLLNYIRVADKDLSNDSDCALVAGQRYEEVVDDSSVTSEGLLAPLPKPLGFELDFLADGQKVTISKIGETTTGIYDCQFGVLHIHRDEGDTSPMLVGVKVKGTELVVSDGEQSIQMTLVEQAPSTCTLEYDPVCAAKDNGVRCITTPCPSESYQTYSNTCHAKVDNARVIFDGECGKLEGTPVDDSGPVVCTKEYAPVCGVLPNTKPCTTMPCPASTWETYSNQCVAEGAGAKHIQPGACETPGQIVVEIPESICPAIYAPVCAKDEYAIQCLVAPCTTHQYKTFSNSCAAAASYAEVAFDGQCDKALEGVMTFGQPLVKITEFESTEARASVIKGSIEGDVAFVTLGYSGCDQQHFDFFVDPSFMESFPVQVKYQFIPQTDDACLASFQTSFEYDLLPLKVHYQQSYQSDTGSIDLGKIGVYQF